MTAKRPSITQLAVLAGALVLSDGCGVLRPAPLAPDETYRHRFEENPDGRVTLETTEPEEGASFFVFDVPIDSVQVRPAPPAGEKGIASRPVEVLIKGTLPDTCSTLHAVRQRRMGHFNEMTLEMRKTRGQVCAPILTRFRFYEDLEGVYDPGDYVLKLNGGAYPFQVR